MPRKPRELVDHGVYHVIHRGNHQKKVFEEDRDYRYFLRLLKHLRNKYPYDLYHYCLMPNHTHLMLQIQRGEDLSKLAHGLFRGYSQWHQARYGLTGHLWQGRFKSPRIDGESYFIELGRYIERNPVRAGMVKRPEEYPWSSFRYYTLDEANDLITRDPYYEALASTEKKRRARYQEFLDWSHPHDGVLDEILVNKPV